MLDITQKINDRLIDYPQVHEKNRFYLSNCLKGKSFITAGEWLLSVAEARSGDLRKATPHNFRLKGGTKQAMCCLWLRRFSIQAEISCVLLPQVAASL